MVRTLKISKIFRNTRICFTFPRIVSELLFP